MCGDSSNGLGEYPFPHVQGGGSGVDDPHAVLRPVSKIFLICLEQLRTALRCSVSTDVVICVTHVGADDDVDSAGPTDVVGHSFITDPAGLAGAGANRDHVGNILPGLFTVMLEMVMNVAEILLTTTLSGHSLLLTPV